MNKNLKSVLSTLATMLLGGLLASYLENLRKILENGILSISYTISDMLYKNIADFEPYGRSLALVILLILTSVLVGLVIYRLGKNDETRIEQNIPLFEEIHLYIGLLIIPIGLFTVALMMYLYIDSAKENKKFEHTIIILTPYIAEKEINLLKSKWALMRNKDDYKNINKKIDYYYKLAGIKKFD